MNGNDLFEDICRELQDHPSLGANYESEENLETAVFEVIDQYVNAKDLPLTVRRRSDVEGIEAFGREKTPDMAIDFQGKRFIAIEVKNRRASGWELSRGMGQAITYSVKYPYGIIFIRDSYDKDPAVRHDYDDEIKSSLMRHHNIRLMIRYDYGL